MTDAESSSRTPRQRPTYGLPDPQAGPPAAGPTAGYGSPAPAPADGYGAPAPQAAPSSAPYGSPAPSPYGAPAEGGSAGGAWSGGGAPAPGGWQPAGGPAAPPRKRRGVLPLVLGLVLLLVLGPIAFIGGLVWGVGSIVGDTMSGPTTFGGSSAEIEIPANEMIIVYVPTEDAGASCTAEGAVTTVPSSGTTTFPDGTSYDQALGVVATADTTATITCEGTEGAGYMGPYNVFGVAGPMIIGPVVGVVLGLVGLVLTIVGIVLMVRSRRS